MAFTNSLTSGWQPLWKGLGLEASEELPSPDSLGSSFDNSIKKGVSFAKHRPVLLDGQDGEEKKQGWNWRRKQSKSKAVRKRREVQKRIRKEEAFFDEYSDADNSDASIDSFEERAMMENRDEQNLDGDLWEGSDTREQGNDVKESQGLWTFFAFGNNENDDDDDGWTDGGLTEGDSTFYTEGTDTSRSSYIQRNNSTVSSLDSEGAGEEVEVEIRSNRSLTSKTEDALKPAEKTPIASNSCLLPASSVEWYQRGSVPTSSRPNIAANADIGGASELGNQQHGVVRDRYQTIGESSAASGPLSEPKKIATNKKSKKKTRWKVGRGKTEHNKSSRKDSVKPTPPAQTLNPISEEQRDEVTSHRKAEFGVDEGERGIAHKSCMPVIFNERQRRSREPIGMMLCRSEANPYHTMKTPLSSVPSDLTSQATSQASAPMPQVRIVSDNQGNQGPTVVGKATDQKQSDIRQQMQLEESHFASSQGPQSIYTYEYDSGTPMDVSYKQFEDDAEEVLRVREYVLPMKVIPGTSDVVIMVEASTISLSDCRIRQGRWWGFNDPPLPNIPGVDMVGKVHSINERTRNKYRLKPGDRVMSLVRWSGNSRYSKTKANQLVKVPKGVDPVEATCLAEAYLSAFQALQYSQSSWARYSSQSLIGKSVLVIGGMTNVGHAVIELAVTLGAMEVYATAKGRHRSHLDDLGAIPIDRKPKLWPSEVVGMIDLVIDATGDVAGDHANVSHFNALHDQGNLIFIGLRDMTDAVAREWDVSSTLLNSDNTDDLVNRTHSLEVFDNWELDLDRSKNDLEYLLRLLEQELIKPVVRDVLPLAKVARAQALLETKRIEGYLVCEPWIKSKSRAVYL